MLFSACNKDTFAIAFQHMQTLHDVYIYDTCIELANNYKEDGNFNYKYKKYRLAVISYTEGIKTNCQDQELMAQLYNNRAAAQFLLKNYRLDNILYME